VEVDITTTKGRARGQMKSTQNMGDFLKSLTYSNGDKLDIKQVALILPHILASKISKLEDTHGPVSGVVDGKAQQVIKKGNKFLHMEQDKQ